MKKIKKDTHIRRRLIEVKKNGLIFNVLGLLPFLWGLGLVILIVWALLVSFAEPNWYLDNSNTFLVTEMTLKNYKTAIENFRVTVNSISGGLREAGFWEMTFNSIWFTIGATAIKMFSTICFAYAVARFEFPGRKILYGFVILQMMLPIYGQTASNYSLLSKMGLVNTPWFILALGAGHGMYFLITYSFFRNLPTGYEEAAMMDGAGSMLIYWRIMLPLAKPIVTALGIMTAIGVWNDYSSVLVYLRDFPNLATGLYMVKEVAFTVGLQTPSYFAAIFVSVIPVVTVFLIFNKQIMNNVSVGGLKG